MQLVDISSNFGPGNHGKNRVKNPSNCWIINWALRFAVSHAGPEPRYVGPGSGRDSGEAVKQLQVRVTCFNNPTFGER